MHCIHYLNTKPIDECQVNPRCRAIVAAWGAIPTGNIPNAWTSRRLIKGIYFLDTLKIGSSFPKLSNLTRLSLLFLPGSRICLVRPV